MLAQSLDESVFDSEAGVLPALMQLSTRLFRARTMDEGLNELLSSTMDLLKGHAGNIQLLDSKRKALRLVAHNGFDGDFAECFKEVFQDAATSCARALHSGSIVTVEDIELDAGFQPYRAVMRGSNLRSVVSAPLVSHDDALRGMITVYFATPHRPSDAALRDLMSYASWGAEFIKRLRLEQELRESEERFRLALATRCMGVWDWDVQTGSIKWNDAHYSLLGYEVGEVEPTYHAWATRVHPKDRMAAEATLWNAMRERREFVAQFRVVWPDGTVRWCFGRGSFIYDAGESPSRMIGLIEDVTDRRKLAESQKVLVAELQHRTRNLITVVKSIAEQTLPVGTTIECFLETFNARLDALARVQNLLSQSDERSRLTLGTLVRTELNAFGIEVDGVRTVLNGPRIELRQDVVQTFALAVHELATNARKYGALASDRGRLAVSWRWERVESSGEQVLLEWVEEGLAHRPEASDRDRRGYGRTLIEEALPYTLEARTRFELCDDHFYCSILIPAETMVRA
jgi:PAS domain S-box-containing protein